FELEGDLVVAFGELADADIDLDIDRGLRLARRQRARRIRILEREVLDVLGEDSELRLALLGGLWAGPRAAVTGGRHERFLSPVTEMLLKVAAWLTQGHRPDKLMPAGPPVMLRLWICAAWTSADSRADSWADS